MTAVDWSAYPEPWRNIGEEFAEVLPALCNAQAPLPPPRPLFLASLGELRRKLGLSQRELAQRVGCHSVTIGDYERGRYQPSPAIRERLVAILLPEAPP